MFGMVSRAGKAQKPDDVCFSMSVPKGKPATLFLNVLAEWLLSRSNLLPAKIVH
jgi:hypothetical protein